jgi:hypothetical protein
MSNAAYLASQLNFTNLYLLLSKRTRDLLTLINKDPEVSMIDLSNATYSAYQLDYKELFLQLSEKLSALLTHATVDPKAVERIKDLLSVVNVNRIASSNELSISAYLAAQLKFTNLFLPLSKRARKLLTFKKDDPNASLIDLTNAAYSAYRLNFNDLFVQFLEKIQDLRHHAIVDPKGSAKLKELITIVNQDPTVSAIDLSNAAYLAFQLDFMDLYNQLVDKLFHGKWFNPKTYSEFVKKIRPLKIQKEKERQQAFKKLNPF